MDLVPLEQEIRLIPKGRLDFQVSSEGLVLTEPFARTFGVAQLPGVTRQEVGKGIDFRKGIDLVQQIQVRVQGSIQLEVTIRQAEPATRSFGEHLGEHAGHVTGGLPVSNPSFDLPPHHEHLRVKAIQPHNPLCLRLGFEGISQFKPADGKIQVMPFRISEYLHELSRLLAIGMPVPRQRESPQPQTVMTEGQGNAQSSFRNALRVQCQCMLLGRPLAAIRASES